MSFEHPMLDLCLNEKSNNKCEKAIVKRRRMTTIIGGKCTDGVVLIADRKVIRQDGPDTYRDKIFSPYHPIIIGSAGNNDLIDKFIQKAFTKAQEMHEKSIQGSFAPVSGSVFWSKTQDANRAINYIEYLNELEDVVRNINDAHKYGLDPNSLIDCLIGVWTQDRGSKLSYISPKGLQSDVEDYRVIGSGEPYSHVFLRSLLEPSEQLTMLEFAKIGYFVIKWLDRFEVDKGTGLGGGRPMMWFMSGSGESKNGRQLLEIIQNFECKTNRMLENWKIHGLDTLLKNQ